MFSYYGLQLYWWFLVSLIGGLLVFMMFVQGGQTLLYTLGKTEDERDLIINSLGRKWELGFTTLVMFGGALFAAFPLFYAVSFGGAYYLWMGILFCFIIQAVSYEYRKKPNNLFGEKFYEWLLFINGSVGIFLIGVAIGTLYKGGYFVVDDMNLSHWTKSSYGLEAILEPFNIIFGLVLVYLARVQALLYFYNNLKDISIEKRVLELLKREFFIFLPLFLILVAMIFLQDGYGYDKSGVIFKESQKLLHNILKYPILAGILVGGILSFLYGIYLALIKHNKKAIWFSGLGTIAIVTILLLILGINHTVYYPSLSSLQSSLTIENSSGSPYTLEVMSGVTLMLPFVLGYIFLVWRSMDKKPLSIEEVKNDPHHY